MKKFTYLFVLIALFLFTSCDYNPGVSEAFTKYRFKDGVTTITVPGWVIHLAARGRNIDRDERMLLKSIDKVRVLSIDNDDLNARVNLNDEFENYINRNSEFETLMTVKNTDDDVTVFARMDEDVIREMVVLVGGEDNALVYIKGQIDPELISDNIKSSDREKLFSLNF